ncbi:hypothetical protein TNCV_2149941 [Trichonephila clavipes]|nr:hypothetical protein TNCV_2149941 [Trichonephila clavipes]
MLKLHLEQAGPSSKMLIKSREIIQADRHVSNRSISHVLKNRPQKVLSHLRKVGFKKKARSLGATPIDMINRIFIYETLAELNDIIKFLNRW